MPWDSAKDRLVAGLKCLKENKYLSNDIKNDSVRYLKVNVCTAVKQI